MLRKLERKPSPVLLVQAALYLVATAAAVAVGIDVGFRLDEPKTVTETVILDAPPACREIAPAVQAERATAATLAAAHERSLELSEAYGAAVLSIDPEAIEQEAAALDEALRDVQRLVLDLAADQATTDATVGDCTPERPE